MFGWLKRTEKNPRWTAYTGRDIWVEQDGYDGQRKAHQPPDFQKEIANANDSMSETCDRLRHEYGLVDEAGTWEVMPESGMFRFTTSAGRTWRAPFGVVASWASISHSWLWAWAIDDAWVFSNFKQVANDAKKIGLMNSWLPLTAPFLLVNEHEAMRLAKLAANQSNMPIVHQISSERGDTSYILAIGHPVWENTEPQSA